MSFSRKRHSLSMALALVGVAVAGLLAFAIFRGASQNEPQGEETDSLQKFLENPKSLTPAEKEEMRVQWDRLSPASKSRITMTMMRKGIEKFREETSKLSQEERLDKIRKEVDRLRRDREKLTDAAKAKVQKLLTEADTQKIVKDGMEMFQKELSAQERAELDPLAHEYVNQLNCVFR